MADIINFNEVKSEIKQANRKLKIIFNDVKNFTERRKKFSEYEYYDILFKDFFVIHDKLKKDKWSDPNNIDFLNKFERITYDEDKINKYTNKLEYIRLYDKFKKEILNLSDESVKIIFHLVYVFYQNIDSFSEIIKWFNHPIIKKVIDSENNYQMKLDLAESLTETILEGNNPLEYAISIQNEHKILEEEKTDDLTNGIITIERIHEYFSKQAFYLNCLLESSQINKQIININKMLVIRKFGNSVEIKFISLINIILESTNILIEQLKLVSDLVEIFIYYREKIDKIDISKIESLLFYKNINEKSIEEVSDFFERRL